MNQQWKAFLSNHGAVVESDKVSHFGDPDAELRAAAEGTVLCDLSHLGLIRIQGEDAREFLHNQFSSDINQLSPETSQLSSYNSAKGRMYAVFRLFMREGGFYMALPSELADALLQRLRMFVLMSKATLEDASDELVGLGIGGTAAEAILSGQIDEIPAVVDKVVQAGPLTVIRVEGEVPRFLVFGPVEAMAGLWEQLAAQATPAGEDAWVLQEIRAGLPVVHTDTREAFVPQMTNLQLVKGVSFTKGCYPGQEIVARTQYLGTLKRRMYRAAVQASERPRPGQEVFTSEADEAQGSVVEACPSPDGGYELLAVLNIVAAEGSELHLGDPAGPALRLEPLPYAFDAVRKEATP
jgi:folate-binding protein YgfZ